MIKVCFLTPEYLPIMGGTGSYVYYLAEKLARFENTVYILTKNRRMLGEASSPSERVKVFRIKTPYAPLFETILFYKRASRKLLEIDGKFRIDVVHVNLPLVPFFAVPRAFRGAVVATVHTTWKGENDALKNEPFLELNANEKVVRIFNEALRFSERKMLERADRIIAVSTFTKNELLEGYGIDAKKVQVIPNGVDINKFKPPDEKDKVKQEWRFADCKVVLYVGRLYRRKGLTTFLRAASIILRKFRNVKFVISGGGFFGEEERLRALARKLRIEEAVVFLGYIPDKALPKLYQAADVFVLPSIYEGMPFTVLEALASGLPVVATKAGGIPEVIDDGKNGFLVSPMDYQGLADKVLYLLENPKHAREMGFMGRKRVEERFSWHEVAKQVLEVYNEVLAK